MLFGFTIKAQVLTLSRNAVQLSWQDNSSDTIKVFSNTSWTCGFDQNWLSVSSAGGTGDSIISITATANPSTTSRTAHLTVSGTGVASQTVTITQTGSPLLSVSSDSLVIGALANSTCSLKITSLPDWSASSDQTWLTVSSNSGIGDATIILTAAANPGTASRTATITVTGIGVATHTITVTQNGITTGLSTISEKEFVIYPNPASTVLCFNSKAENVKISIFDLNGKLVLNKQMNSNQINISDLPKGFYAIRIENSRGIVTKKFVKQ